MVDFTYGTQEVRFLVDRGAGDGEPPRAHLYHAGAVPRIAPETMHRAIEARQVLEAANARKKLTMKRAISNYLRPIIFDNKRANEHLKHQLKIL